jgi:hypothetical protein
MRWSFIAAAVLLAQIAPAETGSFAYYQFFIDEPMLGGYWGDGFVCSGPFRCNGPICIWSASAGSDNDPWFYSLTLGSPFYYYSTGTPTNPATTPIFGNLTIQPIEFMEQGPPWFNLGAEAIPYGPDSVNWQEARDAALGGGLFFSDTSPLGPLPSGTRFLLREDSLFVKTGSAGVVQAFWLGGLPEPVVWVDNGSTDKIYIKDNSDTWPGLTMPLTIGSCGDIFLAGPLTYGDSMALLGLVTVDGDLIFAEDPENEGWPPDWAYPWDIRTNADFGLCASMISLDGVIAAENWTSGPLVEVAFYGGFQVRDMGIFTGSTSGFWYTGGYDPSLLTDSPPHYPCYDTGTGIAEQGEPALPGLLTLSASINPFAESATVQAMGVPGAVEYLIYDLSGRLLMEQSSPDGSLQICGPAFPPGVLIVRATSRGSTATLRLVHIAE